MIRVSPALVQLELERGQELALCVTAGNDGQRVLNATVFVGDLQLTPDGLPVICAAGSQPHSCVSWLTVDSTPLRLEPGQAKPVAVRVRVPAAARGGAYGVIGFRMPVDMGATDGNQVSLGIEGLTGAVLMFTVKGPRSTRVVIKRVSATRDPDGRAVAVAVEVENQGEAHLRCSGEMALTDSRGRVLGRVALEAGTGTVLPGGWRTLKARWEPRAAVPPGTYRASARVKVEGGPTLRQEMDFEWQ